MNFLHSPLNLASYICGCCKTNNLLKYRKIKALLYNIINLKEKGKREDIEDA